MSGSTVSRRVSEFVGVALFAAALIWIIALASYDPTDPVWFFSTGAHGAAVNNFVGRVGAFLAELSFQLFGYASYLIPAVLVIIGWNYFWCRSLDAAGTKGHRREPARRLLQRAAESRLRQPRRVGQVVPRRRLRGRLAREDARPDYSIAPAR